MKQQLWAGIAILALALPASAAPTPEPDLPLWEVGLFGGAASTPAYPGSADRESRALVLPMLIYRGKVLRADRSGVSARLFDTERVDLDLGFQMSLPARSDDVPARAGMPDLNSLLEFGPRLKVLLSEPSAANRVRLELPLRMPLELGNGFRRQGLVFEPRVVFETSGSDQRWNADANLGMVFGNARLNQYFYEVAPQYATASRPAYEAKAGLMMTRVGLSLSHALTPDWRVFGFTRYDNYTHAANRDSPLFRKNSGLSIGFGFTWTAYRSQARAWE
ncbi:Outer membrane scaffolding protein for murein synthesis, MipA/OmpV family [Duganella sp. CF458]|uniref:MipA/OmpV family protein n=1 Tax=Duganella sp. CF458 TaxID=1884368 RepID=UPI0008E80C2A|nr:MipA/OmpV family protein [Duganella sp. CF458]SFG10018.1 Outer membrane scaffolding protein for murein synthesis, MipA/OmpV family [Duganella sp. CF458]